MTGMVKCWCRDENAVTIVEYGLLLSLVGLVVAVAAQTVGTEISSTFRQVGTYLASAPVPSSP